MNVNKTSISKARSYQQIGEFWDSHDLNDYWEQSRPADFDVEIRSDAIYWPVETQLSAKLRSAAQRRGVSAETLVNLWLQEKLSEQGTSH